MVRILPLHCYLVRRPLCTDDPSTLTTEVLAGAAPMAKAAVAGSSCVCRVLMAGRRIGCESRSTDPTGRRGRQYEPNRLSALPIHLYSSRSRATSKLPPDLFLAAGAVVMMTPRGRPQPDHIGRRTTCGVPLLDVCDTAPVLKRLDCYRTSSCHCRGNSVVQEWNMRCETASVGSPAALTCTIPSVHHAPCGPACKAFRPSGARGGSIITAPTD
jgi:hypothetical protein